GGVRDGLGSGARGSGTGGGGTGARLIRGQIVNRDYPRDARRDKLGGSVTVRFTVTADGRARGCSVMQSSGVASLDATTCRLVEQRFRYAPARDAAGSPIAEQRGWRQTWWLEGLMPPPVE
ncbi:MAG: energy transducer TonB, partial [Pseudomonadota bacterium]|nr:energy transducer TonB [Pseudomonadota bacterium]